MQYITMVRNGLWYPAYGRGDRWVQYAGVQGFVERFDAYAWIVNNKLAGNWALAQLRISGGY